MDHLADNATHDHRLPTGTGYTTETTALTNRAVLASEELLDFGEQTIIACDAYVIRGRKPFFTFE